MFVLIGGFRYRKHNVMPCYRPITVQLKRDPIYGGPLMTYYDDVEVPCGYCVGCKAERGRQWGVRMMHEARMWDHSAFVTLTLDDEHLNENRELCPQDLSRFVRSLRKKQEGRLSFFGCGEYGPKTIRPHYHAVLFNIRFLDQCTCVDTTGREFGWSKTLEDTWGRGNTEVGSVTMASACYVAGYIVKKEKARDATRANPYTGELLVPEFARMSLRPAIGQKWIEQWWRDVYPRDFVVVDGYEAKPPRYYDKWMAFPDEKGGTQQRRDIMETVKQVRWMEALDNRLDDYSMKAAEKTKQSRINLFSGRDAV